jgi:hypothetical protein
MTFVDACCNPVARKGDRDGYVAGRAAGGDAGARPLLGDGLRLAQGRGKLNALPQFIAKVDGLDIHFIHVRSKHKNALPLRTWWTPWWTLSYL